MTENSVFNPSTGQLTMEKLSGTSAVVVESPRARVSIEIERMSKGPAKVSVRVDGDDSESVAREALHIYGALVIALDEDLKKTGEDIRRDP